MPEPPPPAAVTVDRAAAVAALARYDLPADSTLRPIRATNNAVFAVVVPGPAGRQGDRYALRVHRPGHRSATQTRSELHLLRVLSDVLPAGEFRVPRPVPARDGALVTQVPAGRDGFRTCDLLSWVDGRVHRPGRGLGPKAVFRLGQGLALVHRNTSAAELPPWFDLPEWDTEAMFGPTGEEPPPPLSRVISPSGWRRYREVVDRTHEVLGELGAADGDRGLIHSDFILGNCHLRRAGHDWRVGIIDFDDCGWGSRLYDLSPMLGNLADFPGYRTRRRALLAGYRSIRQLPELWERHLPLLMAARHAHCIRWAAQLEQERGTGPPAAAHIDLRLQLIEQCLALPY